jgi:hypothetical protein
MTVKTLRDETWIETLGKGEVCSGSRPIPGHERAKCRRGYYNAPRTGQPRFILDLCLGRTGLRLQYAPYSASLIGNSDVFANRNLPPIHA